MVKTYRLKAQEWPLLGRLCSSYAIDGRRNLQGRPQASAGSSLGKRAQAPNEAERGGIATAARALRKGVPRAAVPRRICVSFMRERAPTTLSASAAGIVSDIRSQTLPLFTLTSLSLANRANCYGYETTDAKTRRMLRLLPISLSSHERAPYACMNTMNTEAEELLRNLQGCGPMASLEL